MKKEEFDNGCQDLRILLNEYIPILMQKNWWKDLEDICTSFGIVEGFECMVDDVNRVNNLLEFHDKLQSEEETIRQFILFMKNANRNESEDIILKLSDVEEDWIRLFLEEKNEKERL